MRIQSNIPIQRSQRRALNTILTLRFQLQTTGQKLTVDSRGYYSLISTFRCICINRDKRYRGRMWPCSIMDDRACDEADMANRERQMGRRD
jgi:hypothetical protein